MRWEAARYSLEIIGFQESRRLNQWLTADIAQQTGQGSTSDLFQLVFAERRRCEVVLESKAVSHIICSYLIPKPIRSACLQKLLNRISSRSLTL